MVEFWKTWFQKIERGKLLRDDELLAACSIAGPTKLGLTNDFAAAFADVKKSLPYENLMKCCRIFYEAEAISDVIVIWRSEAYEFWKGITAH